MNSGHCVLMSSMNLRGGRRLEKEDIDSDWGWTCYLDVLGGSDLSSAADSQRACYGDRDSYAYSRFPSDPVRDDSFSNSYAL